MRILSSAIDIQYNIMTLSLYNFQFSKLIYKILKIKWELCLITYILNE